MYFLPSVHFGLLTDEIADVLSLLRAVGAISSSKIGPFIKNALKSRRKGIIAVENLYKAMYSAFDELKGIMVCRLDVHETGVSLMVMRVPVVDRRLSLHPAQSASA